MCGTGNLGLCQAPLPSRPSARPAWSQSIAVRFPKALVIPRPIVTPRQSGRQAGIEHHDLRALPWPAIASIAHKFEVFAETLHKWPLLMHIIPTG